MEQLNRLVYRKYSQANACRMDALTLEAWGEMCLSNDSGMTAFPYLWRRFGPPQWESDPRKDLCRYVLTTDMYGVFLQIRPAVCPLQYCVSVLLLKSVGDKCEIERTEYMTRCDQYLESKYGSIDILWTLPDNEAVVIADEMIAACGECPRIPADWRASSNTTHRRVSEAVLSAMRELLRPVRVRDVSINLFGRVPDGYASGHADVSGYAGYRVPVERMEME